MPRMLAPVIATALLLAAAAKADVVYMQNGKTYEGTVTRQGGKVIIQMPIGGTISVDQADVLTIVESQVSSRPAASKPADDQPAPTGLSKGTMYYAVQNAVRPEPIIFMLMRSLAGTPAASDSRQIREQIESYQILAHDRKRKAGGDWLAPSDFARRRTIYNATLKEAEDLFKKSKAGSVASGTGGTAKRDDSAAQARLRQAAQAWGDPMMRSFLMGAAEYQLKDYRKAEVLFHECAGEAPRVALFHQGRGLALMEIDRGSEALAEFMQALRLCPDSREALRLVRLAMEKTPGSETKLPAYQAAVKLVATYEDTSGASASGTGFGGNGTPWLMPGKELHARVDSLPTPPFDRLMFRQAVAVPVGPNTLMVDAAVVKRDAAAKDSLEVFVRIDGKTLVPAEVKQVTATSRGKTAPPLALLNVSGCTFTPLAAEKNQVVSDGDAVTVYGLGVFEDMGADVRNVPATYHSAPDGSVTLSTGLVPGEAAGPVVGGDAKLVGFLAGKTDASADGGGSEQFIPLSELLGLIDQAKRGGYGSGGYSRLKRTVTGQTVSGQTFVVYVTAGETLE